MKRSLANRWGVNPVLIALDDRAVVDLQMRDDLLGRARAEFSSQCARLEQAEAQAKPPGVIDRRRVEFDAVIKIARILGVDLLQNVTGKSVDQ